MKLLMLKGLPASGKSTYAKELAAEGWVRTNKDELRQLMHGGKWSGNNEKEVIAIRDAIVRDALERTRNVVVDDTNFHPPHEEQLRAIAKEFKAEFQVKYFDTDVEECIKRDLARPNSVGENVIRTMWRQYVAPVQERPLNGNPVAAIFDVDGTLAEKGDRGQFEWEKVISDSPNVDVISLAEMFQAYGYKILIFSGRDGSCKEDTEEWLKNWSVPYDEFHIRPEGDNRKDSEIKREFYDDCINRYDIRYAVDDRHQVARLWHELGLCLLKVGDPDIKF